MTVTEATHLSAEVIQVLGQEFVRRSLDIDPHHFTYNYVAGIIFCEFSPPDDDDPTVSPADNRFYKFLGLKRTRPVSSLELILSICELIPPLNNSSGATGPIALITPERFGSVVGDFLRFGIFDTSQTFAWPSPTKEANHFDRWPHTQPDGGMAVSKPLGLFATGPISSRYYFTTEYTFAFKIHRSPFVTTAQYELFSKRSPRKWGRAWTPRWELEHAALVRQRKFARNQKKIEEDNMKLRKRRTAKSRKRRAEKKRRDRRKLLAVPKVCKPPVKYKVRRQSKRKK